jgi:3-oxoacyl-[acyl-carrier-protein] synthase II
MLARVLAAAPIDLIHAHGTGTPTNDSIELSGLEQACRNIPAPAHIFSNKGALGHTLGASGLVSLVLNVMMHQKGAILPNVNTTTPMAASPTLKISRAPVQHPITRSLVLAAGFGGALAAVSLKK